MVASTAAHLALARAELGRRALDVPHEVVQELDDLRAAPGP